jgi:hypothetical protein
MNEAELDAPTAAACPAKEMHVVRRFLDNRHQVGGVACRTLGEWAPEQVCATFVSRGSGVVGHVHHGYLRSSTRCAADRSVADRDPVATSSVSLGRLVVKGSKGLRVRNEGLIVMHRMQG